MRRLSGSTVLAIGEFDGFHRGHRALLNDTCAKGRDLGLPVIGVVLVLANHRGRALAHPADRCRQLVAGGAAMACLLEVDNGATQDHARAAVRHIAELAPTTVFLACSPDHSPKYPALRPALSELTIPIVEVPRVILCGDTIPSASVRQALHVGDVELCHELLGRLFNYRGTVTLGDQRGRLLGFPTANLAVDDNIVAPCNGVYSAWATLESGEVLPAAVNVGHRPTFYASGGMHLVEAHLLDFEGDLYGTQLSISFVTRLRAERKFDSIDSLRTQLARDIAATRVALDLP